MSSIRRRLVLAAGLALLPGLAGCASDSETRDQHSKAIAPTPRANHLPKKADLPDLPSEAGKIDEDAPEEFTRTKSGLYYRILRKSNGRRPLSVDRVLAHYKGWLKDGKQFDSSYDRGEPTEFALNAVVPGWTEGLQLVGEGGMIELEVPARLGYGAQPHGSIPSNSPLHFLIELIEIK